MNLKHKRIALLALAALAAAFLLRQVGALNVQLYRATLVSDFELWKSSLDDPPARLTLLGRIEKPSTKTITDVTFSKFSIGGARPPPAPPRLVEPHLPPAGERHLYRALLSELESEFAAGGVPSESRRASLMYADLAGTYWVPLTKRGTCRYAVSLPETRDSNRSRVLFGEIDFNVEGLLTARDLEETLARKIAAQVAKYERETRS
jgi:hypothetical protein